MPKTFLSDKEFELLNVLRKAWKDKKMVIVNLEQTAEELSLRNYKIINYIKEKVPFGSFTVETHAGEGVKIFNEQPVKYI